MLKAAESGAERLGAERWDRADKWSQESRVSVVRGVGESMSSVSTMSDVWMQLGEAHSVGCSLEDS